MVHIRKIGHTEVRGCFERWCLDIDMRSDTDTVIQWWQGDGVVSTASNPGWGLSIRSLDL